MWISTDLENRKIFRVFFYFIACQAQTKIREVHQEILYLKHCIATESHWNCEQSFLWEGLGVGVCVDLRSFGFHVLESLRSA